MTGIQQVLSSGGSKSPYLLDIIAQLGLSAGLVCCLDAADTRSYDGTSQTWTDASGNGAHFYRGTTGSAAGDDPAFNGTAGIADENTYFSVDGGDQFRNVANDNPDTESMSFNDGATTLAMMLYTPNVAGNSGLFDQIGSGFNFISQLWLDASEKLNWRHTTSIVTSETITSTASVPTGAWSFVALAFDEAVNALDYVINNTIENHAFASSSFNAAHASINSLLAASNVAVAQNTTRLACLALWMNTRVATADLSLIKQLLKDRRFPSLP
jgi:hypothetical protein